MASVIISRIHFNGNLTLGIYMVDLLCLGIKDTLLKFNESSEIIEKTFPQHIYMEIDYNLAHNIVYAGHDFAYEFDITPHKDFETTKYVLEEDNESIPLTDIELGEGENNTPLLMCHYSYDYTPIIKKLNTHLGEGNYKIYIDGSTSGFEDYLDNESADYDEFIDEKEL